MDWITKLFGGATKGLLGGIGDLVDKFVTTGDEKAAFKLQAAALVAARDAELEQTLRSELDVKARIIEAEMAQSDSYTKRARPTIVYSGLVFTFAHIIGGAFGVHLDIPPEFWPVWGGVCGLWIIGRSVEKVKVGNGEAPNKLTQMLTG
jgi:hypothetical protein